MVFRNIIINKTIGTTVTADGATAEDKLDIYPFRESITIPSLACKINRDHFLPKKNTIEAYTDPKNINPKSPLIGYITS